MYFANIASDRSMFASACYLQVARFEDQVALGGLSPAAFATLQRAMVAHSGYLIVVLLGVAWPRLCQRDGYRSYKTVAEAYLCFIGLFVAMVVRSNDLGFDGLTPLRDFLGHLAGSSILTFVVLDGIIKTDRLHRMQFVSNSGLRREEARRRKADVLSHEMTVTAQLLTALHVASSPSPFVGSRRLPTTNVSAPPPFIAGPPPFIAGPPIAGLVPDVAVALPPNSSSAPGKAPISSSSKVGVAPIVARKNRVLTVPLPPRTVAPAAADGADRGAAAPAPNAVLVSAMQGQLADWDKINRMAAQMSNPSYSLRAFFDDCVGAFPELRLFFVECQKSRQGALVLSSSGRSNEAEYQRTVGALFACYFLLRADVDVDGVVGSGKQCFCFGVDDDWAPIAAPDLAADGGDGGPKKSFFTQSAEERRSSFLDTADWAQFAELVESAGCSAGHADQHDNIVALLCLTAFHDIMKVSSLLPTVTAEHGPFNGYAAGETIHDHDVALAYVLTHFPELLPSFSGLPEKSQQAILFTQSKLDFNHGWFVQAEAPPSAMLTPFKKAIKSGNPQHISLYFLHWITDLAGAEAKPLDGAGKLVLSFPHHVLESFLWSIPFLRGLATQSETQVMEDYLKQRWERDVGLPLPDGPEAVCLLRLTVMAQAQQPAVVVDAFKSLPADCRLNLAREMAHTGCEGQAFSAGPASAGPAVLVYYGPALMQVNASDEQQSRAALEVLASVLVCARQLWPLSTELAQQVVKVDIGQLKAVRIGMAEENMSRRVWVMVKLNENEASVQLASAVDLLAMQAKATTFRPVEFEGRFV
jgi:hypothetical protein